MPKAWEPKGTRMGEGDKIGAGDSYLAKDILGEELSRDIFRKVKEEVKWDVMHHRGGEVPRLVAVQGQVETDGSFPIYRHPSDESPPLNEFTPTVSLIRNRVQQLIGHPVNHALIQFYRSGKDYISEHSDKTVDVIRGSYIVNVSLGARRVMTLRQKKDRIASGQAEGDETTGGLTRASQRIPLPHGSMFVMGLETNKSWLHGINHDNRPVTVKSDVELMEDGGRISLTFRHIGTFLTADQKKIYGQGATGKTRDEAKDVVNGTEAGERLICAFGQENHDSKFDWDKWYGAGFDVLHFTIKDA
ncbi:hypothetical protein L218DRAFT_1082073 [Marasmius fiardii PR-910]|nr:hypothetical protein L218DRAFT_1082073 [Marasmius fiardii PR-910]